MEMLRDLLALSHVPRWTTHPVARPQSVAEHSYRTAAITMAILDALPETSRVHINVQATVRWAISHDGPEAKTGDVPSPVKAAIGKETLQALELRVCEWYRQELPEPLGDTEIIVGLADTIEALSWLSRYGHAFRDRFDSERIETKLTRRIWQQVAESEQDIPGLQVAVQKVMEVAIGG